MASVRYSFTITLKPIMYKDKLEDQFHKTFVELCHALNEMGKYVLIAEQTRAFNLHYHGTMEFTKSYHENTTNVRKKFVDSFRKSKIFGFVNIKQIDLEPGWKEYISKSFEEMKQIGIRPILKDDLDYYDGDLIAYFGIEW